MRTFDELMLKVKEDHKIAKQIDDLGGVQTRTEQSDKLGFDWLIYSVNYIDVRKDYIPQENPKGTIDNPIIWYEGVPMINNAFYLKDGALYVYMNGELIPWDLDDENVIEDIGNGSYITPFMYHEGMNVVTGMWYTDGDNIWEALKNGIPTSFADTEYFDIIVV